MKTSDLIHQLQQDLTPVKPQLTPWKWSLTLFVFINLLALSISTLLGYRNDFMSILWQWPYWPRLILSLFILFFSLNLISLVTNPGRTQEKNGTLWLSIFFAIFTLFIFAHIPAMSISSIKLGFHPVGIKCAKTVLLASLMMAVVILFFARKRLVLRPYRVSILTALASLGSALFIIDTHCNFDNFVHIGIFHYLLPLLIMMAFSLLFFSRILKKKISL